MSTSKLWAALALAGLLSTIAVGAQQPAPPAQAFNLQESIPFDAAVRTGTLPNGLRFFIRQNPRPAMRLSLRLAVKAGSLYESEDQQGLAHFLEHMAFNGSAHFKPGELVSYFERTGARLGPHVNAYTSFDETVYMLELPTDSTEIVSNGLNALADFAGGLTLDPEQVDKERGVVIEEWRGRLGAGSRIGDKQLPVLYHQSRYAERLPIGKPEILRSAPASRLRAFYDTWYRPDQMAIVAVGDVDPQQLEAAIRAAFEPMKARAAASAPPDRSVPLHKDLLVNVASDPEVTQSTVQLIWKRPAEEHRVVGDYRRGPGRTTVRPDAQRALHRTGTATRREVPQRGCRRRIAQPIGRDLRGERPGAGRRRWPRGSPHSSSRRSAPGSTGSAPRSSIARSAGSRPRTSARSTSGGRKKADRSRRNMSATSWRRNRHPASCTSIDSCRPCCRESRSTK